MTPLLRTGIWASGFALAKAVIETGSTVISAHIDTTCPPTHAVVRFSVPSDQTVKFKALLDHPVEKIEAAGGQSEFREGGA